MLTLQISPSFSCNCSLAVYCPFLLLKSAASSPMLLLIFSFRGFNAYEKVSKLESTACWLSSEWASQITPFFFFFCSQRMWEDSSDYWHPFNLPQSQQGFLLLLLKFSRASREWEAHCALEVTRHVEERRGKLWEAHFRDIGTMHERDIQTLKLCVTGELLLLCCLFLLIAVMFL